MYGRGLVSLEIRFGPPNCEPYSRSGASGAPLLLHSCGGSPNLTGLGLVGWHATSPQRLS